MKCAVDVAGMWLTGATAGMGPGHRVNFFYKKKIII